MRPGGIYVAIIRRRFISDPLEDQYPLQQNKKAENWLTFILLHSESIHLLLTVAFDTHKKQEWCDEFPHDFPPNTWCVPEHCSDVSLEIFYFIYPRQGNTQTHAY